MEIRYQFRGMSKFRYRNPLRCYKTKVWTDFRIRVRTEIRYSSSYIISLQ